MSFRFVRSRPGDAGLFLVADFKRAMPLTAIFAAPRGRTTSRAGTTPGTNLLPSKVVLRYKRRMWPDRQQTGPQAARASNRFFHLEERVST
jgi:hypothetical protein